MIWLNTEEELKALEVPYSEGFFVLQLSGWYGLREEMNDSETYFNEDDDLPF
jgi:hypothetical protein